MKGEKELGEETVNRGVGIRGWDFSELELRTWDQFPRRPEVTDRVRQPRKRGGRGSVFRIERISEAEGEQGPVKVAAKALQETGKPDKCSALKARQDRLRNFQGPVQNGRTGPLVQKSVRSLRHHNRVLTQAQGPF